jgi:hypothetical protein
MAKQRRVKDIQGAAYQRWSPRQMHVVCRIVYLLYIDGLIYKKNKSSM